MPLSPAVLAARNASSRRRERERRATDKLRQLSAIQIMLQAKPQAGKLDKNILVQKFASKWIKKASSGERKGRGPIAGELQKPKMTRAATTPRMSPTGQKSLERRKSEGRLQNMKRLRAMRRKRSAYKIQAMKPVDKTPSRSLDASHSRSVSFLLSSNLASSKYKAELVPHKHTLKCDRRERVCTIEGATERETVVLRTLQTESTNAVSSIRWYRYHEGEKEGTIVSESVCEVGSGKTYQLQSEDVGYYVTAVVSLVQGAKLRSSAVGPVLPGPASVDSISVEFCPGTNNKICVCKADYWGGREGNSTYRWIEVCPDGTRKNLSKEKACNPAVFGELDLDMPNIEDPRYYFLKSEQAGSKIKVSYRPIRDDGWLGELKTSKSLQV